MAGGLGCVARDKYGWFHVAGGEGGFQCASALAAEAEPLRAGAAAGVLHGWHKLVIESDSKILIEALRTGTIPEAINFIIRSLP
ncbi:unnamed protein product [Prunus armeniaca]|uniref:RNase H type-1 domain-containing protein n=1 Tax=Prunus armeniaca TaxID=36596 RepID=A0A6J5U881_PRUAR|nr:unnamed protein product [Prunus armeniaca]